ncbi:YjiH family protein [uncultured Tissierella sp.]|uniref:YjiH family protein n=1 Tax=uncultured Tissierella sp. TaxID=448160 RepID=UPI002804C691|nr:YjiH family protein [uncultured Tissierella sp.]MDU5083500.1 YjiH family protein [Bacillota bacterium]
MSDKTKKKYSGADYTRFILPSLIGIMLFMIPLKFQGEYTIPVAILSKTVASILEPALPTIITLLITFTGIMTIIYKVAKPSFIEKSKNLKGLFNVNIFWFIVRIVGMIFVILAYFEIGPEWIWNENTGGLLLHGLLTTLLTIFFFAAFLLPLLLDFGLLEFVGAMLTPVMRPIFKLPGRSSIDCITSWLGDGTIGVLLTNNQYEEGYYTTREASVIATTFSAVSITFALVVLAEVGLEQHFVPYYLAVTFAGVVAAIIVPRIPPLSWKKDDYLTDTSRDNMENLPVGHTPFTWGLDQAIEKAKNSTDISGFIKGGLHNVLEMWVGVMPVIMAFGTIATILAEFTSVFTWLGMPFIPILKLLNIPFAVEASQTMIIGFADMFLPSVIGASIESELTRFVIAGTSVTQLIYLSEVGAVILGSKIPVNVGELFIIFIERTLVTLPIIALVGHLLF